MSRRTGAGGSGMTTPYHRIGRNAHRLPADYYADAQAHTISAVPENPRLSEQSGADRREASGESGAADHSPRAQQLRAARTIFGK